MKTKDRKIDFVGNHIAEKTAYFFLIILKLIVISIIEKKCFEMKSLPFKSRSRGAIFKFFRLAED